MKKAEAMPPLFEFESGKQGKGAVDQQQGHDGVGGFGILGKQSLEPGAESTPCDGQQESKKCQQHGKPEQD